VDFDSDNVSRIFKVALKTARSVMESEPLRSLLAMGHVEPARLLNAATGSALYLAIEDHVADVLADESGGKMPEHLINAPERLQTADGRCISVPAKYAEVFKGAKLVPFDEVSGVTMYATSDSAATRGTRALEMLGAVDARSAVGFLQAVVFADSPIPHGMFDPPQKTAFVLSDGAEALDSGLDLLTCQILIEEHRHSTQPPELLPFVQEADALAFVALSQEQLRRAFAKRGENLATLFPHAERTTHLRARDFWTRVNSSLPVQRFTWDHGVATAARVNVQWAGLLALSNAEKR
ncbi:MAG: hypothetical protein ACKVPX_11485, partial [Myxococcaceae bacterium]